MRHKIFGKKLGRSSGHRKMLRRNLITQLFQHERITTTRAKAEAIRGAAEHMITQAKRAAKHPDPGRHIHIRRLLNGRLNDPDVVRKLFDQFVPRYAERPGGYTRMYKIGFRKGDAAEMVILELVDRDTGEDKTESRGVAGTARNLLGRVRGRGRTTQSQEAAKSTDQSAESATEES
jgi:large subunit ribosomal protein L17